MRSMSSTSEAPGRDRSYAASGPLGEQPSLMAFSCAARSNEMDWLMPMDGGEAHVWSGGVAVGAATWTVRLASMEEVAPTVTTYVAAGRLRSYRGTVPVTWHSSSSAAAEQGGARTPMTGVPLPLTVDA